MMDSEACNNNNPDSGESSQQKSATESELPSKSETATDRQASTSTSSSGGKIRRKRKTRRYKKGKGYFKYPPFVPVNKYGAIRSYPKPASILQRYSERTPDGFQQSPWTPHISGDNKSERSPSEGSSHYRENATQPPDHVRYAKTLERDYIAACHEIRQEELVALSKENLISMIFDLEEKVNYLEDSLPITNGTPHEGNPCCNMLALKMNQLASENEKLRKDNERLKCNLQRNNQSESSSSSSSATDSRSESDFTSDSEVLSADNNAFLMESPKEP